MHNRILITFLLFFPVLWTANAQFNDEALARKGLVDVAQSDTTLSVSLLYTHPDNFTGVVLYEGITKAWLRPEAAAMLVKAQQALKTEYPGRSLIIYDAARPMSVQRRMWELARKAGKTNYVSNPARGGGLHNYGMAVDVSILDEQGRPLDMGTAVDHFGDEAHTDNESALLATGRITRAAYDNRRLLRRLMRGAGFTSIRYEWWHFNACTRSQAIARYPLID